MCQFEEHDAIKEATSFLRNTVDILEKDELSVSKLEAIAKVRTALYLVANQLYDGLAGRLFTYQSERSALYRAAEDICIGSGFVWLR